MPPPIPPVRDLPPMEPPVAVVGDVHLCAEQPGVTDRFLAWLGTAAGQARTLVLLGDLFDLWAGRRQQTEPLARRVLAALRAVQDAGTSLAFLPGNRDFLFDGADGLDVAIWPDPVRTLWGERRVLLTHGDQLCTSDRGYQALRRFLYGPFGRLGPILFPYPLTRWLATGLRGLSRRETGKKDRASMDIDYGEARAWMERHAVDVIVAGHVHTGVHHRLGGDGGGEVLVLRDWERGGGIVRFDEDGIRLESP